MKIRATATLSDLPRTHRVGYFIDARGGPERPESASITLPGAAALGDAQGMLDLSVCLGARFSVQLHEALTCWECGHTFKKLYRGFCYPCLTTAASADKCWMNPEHCHHHLGSCRSEAWANARCFTGHAVYLAHTSDLKVGITSSNRLGQRWIEQGAFAAVKLCQTNSRRTAGLIEQYFKSLFSDRTNNKKLVQNAASGLTPQASELYEVAAQLKQDHEDLLSAWLKDRAPAVRYQWSPVKVHCFEHPALLTSADPVSDKLWKEPRGFKQTARLLGVQGKVLMFDQGYISFGSYELDIRLLD